MNVDDPAYESQNGSNLTKIERGNTVFLEKDTPKSQSDETETDPVNDTSNFPL